MSHNGKSVNEILEIEAFFDSNLNFTIRVFTWDQANIMIYAKKI